MRVGTGLGKHLGVFTERDRRCARGHRTSLHTRTTSNRQNIRAWRRRMKTMPWHFHGRRARPERLVLKVRMNLESMAGARVRIRRLHVAGDS